MQFRGSLEYFGSVDEVPRQGDTITYEGKDWHVAKAEIWNDEDVRLQLVEKQATIRQDQPNPP